jgi:hypothetical protein
MPTERLLSVVLFAGDIEDSHPSLAPSLRMLHSEFSATLGYRRTADKVSQKGSSIANESDIGIICDIRNYSSPSETNIHNKVTDDPLMQWLLHGKLTGEIYQM